MVDTKKLAACLVVVSVGALLLYSTGSAAESGDSGPDTACMLRAAATQQQRLPLPFTGCTTYFVIAVFSPPHDDTKKQGSFWGELDSLWSAASTTVKTILLTQPGACVEIRVTDAATLDLIPSDTKSQWEASSRVAMLVSSVTAEEYPCWVSALAAIQREVLGAHRGKNIVFFEADQVRWL